MAAAEPIRLGEREPGYLWWSRRPLHVLAFLAPLIVLYEVGSARYLSGPTAERVETIRAHRLLSEVFEVFGAGGPYLPGILLVVVLLVWQLIVRDGWRVRPRVLGGMALESAGWALAMVVGALVLTTALGLGIQSPAAAAGGTHGGLLAMPWPARATIAIGAGIYEELLFRLVGILVLHLLIVDLIQLPDRAGWIGGVVISAIAFAVYHDAVWGASGELLLGPAVYFIAAGLAFGGIFAWRGFGVVVACHALFDLVLLGLR